MKTINQVTLIGCIGTDLELKTAENGRAYVRFSLATNDKYKDKDGNLKEETDWHKLVLWGSQAEYLVAKAKKGSKLYVEGAMKVTSSEYESITRTIVTIKVDDFVLLESQN